MTNLAETATESLSSQNRAEANAELLYTIPPIASFWRRFFAWLVDMLLLGILGQLVALAFLSFFFRIGPYGRVFGLLFILPYFGILNSRLGGGQTLGKRLFKIAVRNQNNLPIGVGRSLVRILLLTTPALLNGWALPLFQNTVIAWFVSFILFGLGGAILYTMIFNRKARQGIHDLLLGTYVVHLPGRPIETLPTSSRIHWTISAIWVGLVAIGGLAMALLFPTIVSKTSLSSLMPVYQALQADPRFFNAQVNDSTNFNSNGQTSHSLVINVWYKGRLTDADQKEVVGSIAKTVFDNKSDIYRYNFMQIHVTSAYDLGIASGNYGLTFSYSIDDWRRQVPRDASSSSFVP